MLAADVFLLMQPVVEFKVSKYMYIVNIENYGGVGLADVKYCNRSQMTSQRVKNKKVREWRDCCSEQAVTSSVIYYSTHIWKNVIYLFYTMGHSRRDPHPRHGGNRKWVSPPFGHPNLTLSPDSKAQAGAEAAVAIWQQRSIKGQMNEGQSLKSKQTFRFEAE